MIPHIHHQIWTHKKIPMHYRKFMDSWQELNPTFEHKLWGWDEIVTYMEDRHPDKMELFHSYIFDIQRIDMARYFILGDYGGLYTDMDVECLKPFSTWLDEHTAVFGKYRDGRKICNAIMAGIPGHIVFQRIQDNLENAHNRAMTQISTTQYVLQSTGREMLTPIVFELADRVTIVPAKYFYPYEYEDKEIGHALHYPNAYTKHYWNRGW